MIRNFLKVSSNEGNMKIIFCCAVMQQAYENQDIRYVANDEKFKMDIGEGIAGSTTYTLYFCPFCRSKLEIEK